MNMSVHFKNIGELKAALKVEHDTIMDKLRRYKPTKDDFPHKFWRSRGMRVMSPAGNGRERFYDGQWEWKGTKKDLEDAIREARSQGYEKVYIEEGFDGAERIEDWDNGNYEPCVEEFDLCVWSKDASDNGDEIVWGLFPVPIAEAV